MGPSTSRASRLPTPPSPPQACPRLPFLRPFGWISWAVRMDGQTGGHPSGENHVETWRKRNGEDPFLFSSSVQVQLGQGFHRFAFCLNGNVRVDRADSITLMADQVLRHRI